MGESRFHRQELLFGAEGQHKIESCRVAIVGLGGLGSHVAQQLAYLGVRSFACIDHDRVTVSSLNRLVGGIKSDVGALKVDVADRLIRLISPQATVTTLPASFIGDAGFATLRASEFIIGCVDSDACRLILNELCQAYELEYLDIATDVNPLDMSFGGRIMFANGLACISCKDLLDQDALRHAFSSDGQRAEEERIYGVSKDVLGATGPSVVSLNGVLASLAVTEFLVHVTGIRPPQLYLEYRGDSGVVMRGAPVLDAGCYYCGRRGAGTAADVERYIRDGWGERLLPSAD